MRVILSGFFLLPLLASCVSQSELNNLNSRMSRNEQEMQRLGAQVGNVEQILPGQAEMWAQMQAIRQELNGVRGQLDDMTSGTGGETRMQNARLSAGVTRLETAVRQMASQLGIQVEALDVPLEEPVVAGGGGAATGAASAGVTASAGGISSPGTPSTGSAPLAGNAAAGGIPAGGAASGTGASTAPADTATRLYDSGMSAFSSHDYRGAVKVFTDFAKAFPNHALASNAHFWRGESFYQLKDYAGAALAYQEVIQKFSGSAKLQSAMLKQGMAFYYAGKKDAAKLRLDELVKKYPKSPEAGRAKKFMQDNK
ncbi:tol-pal system protein YbgF [Deltaproteobacteria bacterium]|nr:tol-pal system protein YbgF [Deltaproteobacteria bacterium]